MVRVRTKITENLFRKRKPQIRVRSPLSQSSKAYSPIQAGDKDEYCDNACGLSYNNDSNSTKQDRNRVMVVVDVTNEAKGALQWALSHTIQIGDAVILLHIARPSGNGSNSETNKAYELLYSMKSTCETQRPGVHVELVAVAGKDKGPIIVEQAKQQKASLLVLGHRRRSIAWRFWMRWTLRKRSRYSVVDYCIQNADCMTVAVRRKGRKLGGYLITTKRHKKFWLLA